MGMRLNIDRPVPLVRVHVQLRGGIDASQISWQDPVDSCNIILSQFQLEILQYILS